MTRRCSEEGNAELAHKKKRRIERYFDRTIAFADRAPADQMQQAYLDDVSPAEIIRIAEVVRHE